MHEFFMYNHAQNYFTNVRLVTEWTNTGSVLPSVQISSFRINPFRDVGDIVYFAFTMITPIYIFYYTIVYFYDVCFFIIL